MARNIQEYINGLVNKPRIYYLDLNKYIRKVESETTHECPDCKKTLSGKFYCHDCNNHDQLEGEITDLKEFSNLKGINASNNGFTNLEFLTTLPKKDKLKSLNLFGNQIQEIDFAELFKEFPNLGKINLENNPLSAKNLENLSGEQFAKLINGIKERKIRIHSWKGTVLMDLLEYAQKLASQDRTEYQAHMKTLNQVSQSIPTKPEKVNPNSNNTPLLIGGIVLLGISLLGIGYLLSKKKKNNLISSD